MASSALAVTWLSEETAAQKVTIARLLSQHKTVAVAHPIDQVGRARARCYCSDGSPSGVYIVEPDGRCHGE